MTDEDYKAGVDLLILTDPNHPALPELQKGKNSLNVEYLKLSMKKKEHMDIKGEIVRRKLAAEKGKLYGMRAKLSNNFHRYKKREERSVISDQIRKIQEKIAQTDIELQYINENGPGSLVSAAESYHVPFQDEEKRKRIKLIQQKLLHARNRIKDYKKQGKKTLILKNELKIEQWETEITKIRSTMA